MSTWTELLYWCRMLFSEVFRLLDVEIFDGLTFKVLIIGVFMIALSIGIVKFFVSNTHSDPGVAGYMKSETRR